jgi:hypothetical protein
MTSRWTYGAVTGVVAVGLVAGGCAPPEQEGRTASSSSNVIFGDITIVDVVDAEPRNQLIAESVALVTHRDYLNCSGGGDTCILFETHRKVAWDPVLSAN